MHSILSKTDKIIIYAFRNLINFKNVLLFQTLDIYIALSEICYVTSIDDKGSNKPSQNHTIPLFKVTEKQWPGPGGGGRIRGPNSTIETKTIPSLKEKTNQNKKEQLTKE